MSTWSLRQLVQQRFKLILIIALTLTLIMSVLSLKFGAVEIPLNTFFQALFLQADPQTQTILFQLRLPRILLALIIGALLACSGAISQSLFRNELADPAFIGVSAGASAGAALAIVFSNTAIANIWGLSLVSLGASAGATLTVLAVYKLASNRLHTSVTTMLLAGIAISFLAGSFTNIMEYIADNEMLKRISLWRMGGLDTANYSAVLVMLIVAMFVAVALPRFCSSLNALLLGESEARHLGVKVEAVKKLLILIIAVAVGSSVAMAGTIAFIGLMVPHLVRMLVGPNHFYLLPLSAVLGSMLLLITDILARTLLAPAELPVGLITSLLGAPVFLFVLFRQNSLKMSA